MPRLDHTWDFTRRQLRLGWRHLRLGRGSWSPAPSTQRTAELTTLYRTANAFLRETGVDYALAFGTLLGWHREQRLLPHDMDVDFSAPVAAYPVLRDAAHRLPAGFTLHDTSHRHHGPKLYLAYRGWDADIYFYGEKDGQLAPFERSQNPGDVAPFPREFYFPLQPAEFLGGRTFVPAQPVALLTHHYRYLGRDAVRDPVTRYFRPRS